MIAWRVVLTGLICVGLFAALPSLSAGQADLESPWPEDWLYPGQDDPERWRTHRMGPKQQQRFERHQTFMAGPNIQPYISRKNPLGPTREAIDAGAALYAEQCVQCHGASGFGDGDAGLAVDPSPALLKFLVGDPRAVDGYLLWSIAEGGARFGSEMPAYKGLLTEGEMWQIILFMRSGFGRGAE